MRSPDMHLDWLPGAFAVVRLEADATSPVPDWAMGGAGLAAVVRRGTELTVVCDQTLVPGDARAEQNWAALQVRGPMAFELTGVVAGLTAPLAAAGIPVFVLSTYDTDILLIKQSDQAAAAAALTEAGHTITAAPGVSRFS